MVSCQQTIIKRHLESTLQNYISSLICSLCNQITKITSRNLSKIKATQHIIQFSKEYLIKQIETKHQRKMKKKKKLQQMISQKILISPWFFINKYANDINNIWGALNQFHLLETFSPSTLPVYLISRKSSGFLQKIVIKCILCLLNQQHQLAICPN